MGIMKQFILASLLAVCSAPALAQQEKPLEDELLDFFGELTEPLIPLLEDLSGQIKDLRNCRAPEILPNGDILIRRRPDAPTYEPGDEIEI